MQLMWGECVSEVGLLSGIEVSSAWILGLENVLVVRWMETGEEIGKGNN